MDTGLEQESTGRILSNTCQVYCGQGFNERGAVAPCALCEWCGICPQHDGRITVTTEKGVEQWTEMTKRR